MRLSAYVLAASLAFAVPLGAQTPPHTDRPDAIAREGIAKLLRALKLFVDNPPQYAAPEIDAEGNIVIRRLNPPGAGGALWLAARDPRTPKLAKFVALATAAYAFSPIDLVPDFIPVLGLLDDLILVPAGLWLAVKLVPPDLMAEFRAAAEARARPVSRTAAGIVVTLWLICAAAILWAVAAS